MADSAQCDIYLRLSIDREGKDSLERQESDLRDWAAREGMTVRKVWKDPGKSGYKPGVQRPDFDAAVAAVTSGEVAILGVWKLDRLSRRGAGQVGTVLDALDEAGGRIVFLKDNLDSAVANSRMLIVMLSELARAESASTSLRVTAKKEHQRKQGLYLGGTAPFGYTVGADRKLRQHPTEAPLLREACDRLASGETMLAICRDWNDRGVPTRRGGKFWRASSLSVAIRTPSLSGLVPAHKEARAAGYEGGDIHPWRHPDTGETVSLLAEGESPIIAEGERQALLAELDSRLRRYGRGMRAVKQPETLLGGGMLRCAECDRSCNSFGNSYRCRRRDHTSAGCEAPVNVRIPTLEREVKRVWAYGLAALEPDDPILAAVADRWLAKHDPASRTERDALLSELATLRARLDAADADHYVRATLSADRHATITALLEDRIAHATRTLATMPVPEADLGVLLDPELSLPAIEAAPVLEARKLLRLAIDRVIVSAAPYSGARFIARDRMRIVWAEGDAA
ncbi:recombinase family protein [Microbacterium gorillae]|uniref:recombinase family protein n=1 Tax=Microbacterium gorillae TaxID=1231063 RepID=UPI00058D624A|nr:recombinase family protein [Microbacterium gorillae]